MQTHRKVIIGLSLAALDSFVLSLVFILVLLGRIWFQDIWTFDLFPSETNTLGYVSLARQLGLVWLVVPIWVASLALHRSYSDPLRWESWSAELWRLLRSVGFALFILLALLFALNLGLVSRILLVGYAVLCLPALVATRQLMRWGLRRWSSGLYVQRMLIVGDPLEAAEWLRIFQAKPEWGISIEGIVCFEPPSVLSIQGVDVVGTAEVLPSLIESRGIDRVLLVGSRWDGRVLRDVAESCEEVGVTFSLDANFLALRAPKPELFLMEGVQLITFSSTPTAPIALAAKRLMDIGLTLVATPVLIPLFAVVALAIWWEDRGPVFFVQERSGLNGRPFRMFKFRSMFVDAEARRAELEAENEMDGPVFKITSDPRITKVGSFIRKTSIDELPQLINVLRGEMSLVGPRPPIPAEVVQYKRWQRRRLSMRPGITCIWQVSGRNEIDFETWMKLDLKYIDNWSLLLDLKLLLWTAPAVVLRRGAS